MTRTTSSPTAGTGSSHCGPARTARATSTSTSVCATWSHPDRRADRGAGAGPDHQGLVGHQAAGEDDFLARRRSVGHNPPRVIAELNHRELERYVQRVADRWPVQRALLGGARVADMRGARPQRERGPEYVIVLVSEYFDGVPWLERVYSPDAVGRLRDGRAGRHPRYTPAEFERKREQLPACATRPSTGSSCSRARRLNRSRNGPRNADGVPRRVTGMSDDLALDRPPAHAVRRAPGRARRARATSGPSRRSSSATGARCCARAGGCCPRRAPRTRSSRRWWPPGRRSSAATRCASCARGCTGSRTTPRSTSCASRATTTTSCRSRCGSPTPAEDELERRAVVRQTLARARGAARAPARGAAGDRRRGPQPGRGGERARAHRRGGAPAGPPRADRAARRRDRGHAAAGGELGGRRRAPGGPRRPHRRALGRRGGRRLRGAREGRDGRRARGGSRGRARAGGEARRRGSGPRRRRSRRDARRRAPGGGDADPGHDTGQHASRGAAGQHAPVSAAAQGRAPRSRRHHHPADHHPPRRAGRRRPLGRRRVVRRRPRALGRRRREPQRPVQRVRRRRARDRGHERIPSRRARGSSSATAPAAAGAAAPRTRARARG